MKKMPVKHATQSKRLAQQLEALHEDRKAWKRIGTMAGIVPVVGSVAAIGTDLKHDHSARQQIALTRKILSHPELARTVAVHIKDKRLQQWLQHKINERNRIQQRVRTQQSHRANALRTKKAA